MVLRFRAETCVLALKRQEALATSDLSANAEQIQWLHRECKPWFTGNTDGPKIVRLRRESNLIPT